MNRLADHRILILRVIVSLLQGLALWALYEGTRSTDHAAVDGALAAGLLFAPTVAIAGLGALRWRTLVLWSAAAALLCLALGYHAVDRDAATGSFREWMFFSTLNLWLIVLMFIGQSLVVAGDTDRRWIATFPTYFDVAWRHATQLALAILFTAVFFGLLHLGAELFELVKIGFLRTLLRTGWFWLPAMTVTFALAVHFTDRRTAMVRGARTLVLGLLSWLMPIMTVIVVGFLGVLPFTGLGTLWDTRHATAILLSAAGALILLINSHYQDGGPESRRFALLVHTRAVAAIALLPLTVLAAIGLGLRVGQHGWTPSRIVALAFVIAIGCHAVGYFVGVLRSRTRLIGLPITNVLSALVIVVLMVALMTPIADPARLSVLSQLARLEHGVVRPAQFDFAFLHYDSGRYGKDALQRLKDRTDGANASEIATLATAELRRNDRYETRQPPATVASRAQNITVIHPRGATLPESFVRMDWRPPDYRYPDCLKQENARCDALLADFDGDGTVEIVLLSARTYQPPSLYKEVKPGVWEMRGTLMNATCKGAVEALRRGDVQVVPAAGSEIIAGGERLQVKVDCAGR
jgi:hypothetical protein